MDRASRTHVEGVPASAANSYRALADHSKILRSTLHHRHHGRPSIESKAYSQQRLLRLSAKVGAQLLSYNSQANVIARHLRHSERD